MEVELRLQFSPRKTAAVVGSVVGSLEMTNQLPADSEGTARRGSGRPPLEQPAWIGGRIVDEDGRPLSGAGFQARGHTQYGQVVTFAAVSDHTGSFRAEGRTPEGVVCTAGVLAPGRPPLLIPEVVVKPEKETRLMDVVVPVRGSVIGGMTKDGDIWVPYARLAVRFKDVDMDLVTWSGHRGLYEMRGPAGRLFPGEVRGEKGGYFPAERAFEVARSAIVDVEFRPFEEGRVLIPSSAVDKAAWLEAHRKDPDEKSGSWSPVRVRRVHRDFRLDLPRGSWHLRVVAPGFLMFLEVEVGEEETRVSERDVRSFLKGSSTEGHGTVRVLLQKHREGTLAVGDPNTRTRVEVPFDRRGSAVLINLPAGVWSLWAYAGSPPEEVGFSPAPVRGGESLRIVLPTR